MHLRCCALEDLHAMPLVADHQSAEASVAGRDLNITAIYRIYTVYKCIFGINGTFGLWPAHNSCTMLVHSNVFFLASGRAASRTKQT